MEEPESRISTPSPGDLAYLRASIGGHRGGSMTPAAYLNRKDQMPGYVNPYLPPKELDLSVYGPNISDTEGRRARSLNNS